MGSNPLESILKAEEFTQATKDTQNTENVKKAENKKDDIDDSGGDTVQKNGINQPKDDDNTEKKKNKRKDYEKNEITSKADYKIRSKLDAAEKLLDEVLKILSHMLWLEYILK